MVQPRLRAMPRYRQKAVRKGQIRVRGYRRRNGWVRAHQRGAVQGTIRRSYRPSGKPFRYQPALNRHNRSGANQSAVPYGLRRRRPMSKSSHKG